MKLLRHAPATKIHLEYALWKTEPGEFWEINRTLIPWNDDIGVSQLLTVIRGDKLTVGESGPMIAQRKPLPDGRGSHTIHHSCSSQAQADSIWHGVLAHPEPIILELLL